MLGRPLLDTFRSPRASAEDEAAFEAYVIERVAIYGSMMALVLDVLLLAWWPTDALLLAPDPTIRAAMRWFRATTLVNHGVFFVLLSLPALRRWSIPLFALGAVISSVLLGAAMARSGTLDQPFFYMTYFAPLVTIAIPLRLRTRIAANLLIGAAVTAAYLVARPAEIASPFLGTAAGCMVFAVVASTFNGVLLFITTRSTFLHERALARSAEALKGHSEHLEERVDAQVEQIRRLAAHVEQASEAERARISRELHDEMGQQITALRYTLSFVRARFHEDPQRARATLADLEAILADLAASVRRLVSDLRPPVLDDGLGAAVEWLVERTRQRSGLPCDLSISIDDSAPVGPDLANAAFRIVQESLTNAVRHAGAGGIAVALEVDGGAVRARITDDGCGTAPPCVGGPGMGILGMRERARAHGGRFAIESRPGAGTVVSVELPLAAEARP
jgi:signal transduction histidine kinase